MCAQPELESLGVVDVIGGMTDDEVRALVDEAYASGMVQTLSDATRVVSKVLEVAGEPPELHQRVKTT